MSHAVITGAGYTKLNLSYPLAPGNVGPAVAAPGGADETTASSLARNLLLGILIPHSVTTVTVLARVVARLALLRRWFPDDTLVLLAWACSTAAAALLCRPGPPLVLPSSSSSSSSSPSGPPTAARADARTDAEGGMDADSHVYAALLLHQLTLVAAALSTLASHLRVFALSPGVPSFGRPAARGRGARALVWCSVAAVVLPVGAPMLALAGAQCRPLPPYNVVAVAADGLGFVSRSGSGSGSGSGSERCVSLGTLLGAGTGLHAAAGAWVVALGWLFVRRLDGVVAPRRRAGLARAMGLGMLGVAAGVVRGAVLLSWLSSSGEDGDRGGIAAGEVLWLAVLTVLEMDVVLVCANAPTLRPALARVWPRLGMRQTGTGGAEERSVDLTSVVSYHGYPWTRNGTPAATSGCDGGNPNLASVEDPETYAWPVPPLPVALPVHRTPTTPSVRSFMSSMAPRSPERAEGGDRMVLLGDENQGSMEVNSQKRWSSAGLDAYYDQLFAQDAVERRRSRSGAAVDTRRSRGSQSYSGQWADSQESFVMGMNDPNSPKRLSPVSSFGPGDGGREVKILKPVV